MESLGERFWSFIDFFASGDEIVPERIDPVLIPVAAGTDASALFRFASLVWSVPVSAGYGRRLRFLVWDKTADRLMGLMALGDPVFNLGAREKWVGWTLSEKTAGLCNVMDAYVLGAVPPYSYLLVGKLVAALASSLEVSAAFEKKYGNSVGIISKQRKSPRLALVTTTSSLGRSSIYNRLRFEGQPIFERVGETAGWGHFHFSGDTFEKMRSYLRMSHHVYASGHRFGNGPNWRFRAVRETLKLLGIPQEYLRHGIKREVFLAPLAKNTREYLCGRAAKLESTNLSVSDISRKSIDRWIVPRASRDERYRHITREHIMAWILGQSTPAHDIPPFVVPAHFEVAQSMPMGVTA